MSEPPGVALTPSSLLLLPAQTFTVSPKAPQHHPWTLNLSSCNQNHQSREVCSLAQDRESLNPCKF